MYAIYSYISEIVNEIATQSNDEGYKREYRRIKSLVESSYVRQTSVSLLASDMEIIN